MYLLDVVRSMQIVDILRSGALVVAFLSIIIGNRKDRNAVSNWLLVDAISTGGFGLAWLLCPDTLLGYMVSEIYLLIDSSHQFQENKFEVLKRCKTVN
jgi:hypothetical protein